MGDRLGIRGAVDFFLSIHSLTVETVVKSFLAKHIKFSWLRRQEFIISFTKLMLSLSSHPRKDWPKDEIDVIS